MRVVMIQIPCEICGKLNDHQIFQQNGHVLCRDCNGVYDNHELEHKIKKDIDYHKKMISDKLLGRLTSKQIGQEIDRFEHELFLRTKDLFLLEQSFDNEEVVLKYNKYKKRK